MAIEVEKFRREGVLHVRGALDAGDIDRFRAAVDEAVATRKRHDARILAEKSLYEKSKPGSGAVLEQKFANAPPVFIPARAGDVIYHDGRTVNMTRGNRSDRAHQVYTAIYFCDGGATPIPWPLEGARLPEPAPWPPFADNPLFSRAMRLGVFPNRSA